MKGLIMLYKVGNEKDTIHIKEYSQVVDKKDFYKLGKDYLGEDYGIKKSELEKFIVKGCYDTKYYKGMYLPDIGEYFEKYVYFFINKIKYDKNPTLYQQMIKDFKF